MCNSILASEKHCKKLRRAPSGTRRSIAWPESSHLKQPMGLLSIKLHSCYERRSAVPLLYTRRREADVPSNARTATTQVAGSGTLATTG